MAQLVKNLPAMWETWAQSLGWETPLEKGKATHSSILAWRIPWTVESMGSQSALHHVCYFSENNQLKTMNMPMRGASLVAQLVKSLPAMQETPA